MPHSEAAPRSIGASPPPRGGRPGRLEELLRWSRPGRRPGCAPAPGRRPRAIVPFGSDVEQQLHVVDEDRREGLHALDGDALGDLAEQFAQLGVLLGEGRGPLPYLVGQQQLAAGRRPQAVLGDLQGALVGDLEVADLLDVVAPELDPQRVLLGRREDVEDAAAHRELAALLDQFDPGVRGGGQRRRRPRPRSALCPVPQGHRLQVAEALDLRLEHGADGRDDDARPGPAAGSSVARVGEPAQHGEAAADGVGARGEPLVRQRLPGRVLDDALRRAAASAARRPGPRPPARSR